MTNKAPDCKFCESTNTVWDEIGERVKCKDCGERFRLPQKHTLFKKALVARERQAEKDAKLIEQLSKVCESKLKKPTWLTPKKSKQDVGITTAFLSDCHFDEVVDPLLLSGANEYNRAIATKRLKNFFNNVIRLDRDYINGIETESLVLPLGGDLVSGNIHEELIETNEAPIMDTCLYWAGQLAAGIEQLAGHFDKIFIPCVTGNHGRNTKKPKHKQRVKDNFDYLIYKILEREFLSRDNIIFDVSESTEARWTVYETRYQMTHGDQFRGGSGISGIATPIALGTYRKQKREASLKQPFDILIMGHFHQLTDYGHIIINGCFTEKTIVQTEEGIKTICEINIGEKVISRDGSIQTVTHVFEKKSEQGLVNLKIRGLPEVLEVTPNHLIWSLKCEIKSCKTTPKFRKLISGSDQPQWIPADFLSPGDYVHVPHYVGSDETIDMKLAFAYGLFVAEGHTIVDGGKSKLHNRIEYSMHINEIGVLEEIKKTLDTELNKEGRIFTRVEKNTSHLSYSGREISVKFREMFGHLSTSKKVPKQFFSFSPALCSAFLSGWRIGDGHIQTQTDGTLISSATTVSKELAYGMFRIALSAGENPSMSSLEAGGPRKNKTYTIHFNKGEEVLKIDGEYFYRIDYRFRNNKIEKVYDLEVSGEHTYNAGLVGVHNSLKGYDEFASDFNLPFEPPQQAFWITDPKWGKTITAPIRVLL